VSKRSVPTTSGSSFSPIQSSLGTNGRRVAAYLAKATVLFSRHLQGDYCTVDRLLGSETGSLFVAVFEFETYLNWSHGGEICRVSDPAVQYI
jgi:hypothetical protein